MTIIIANLVLYRMERVDFNQSYVKKVWDPGHEDQRQTQKYTLDGCQAAKVCWTWQHLCSSNTCIRLGIRECQDSETMVIFAHTGSWRSKCICGHALVSFSLYSSKLSAFLQRKRHAKIFSKETCRNIYSKNKTELKVRKSRNITN